MKLLRVPTNDLSKLFWDLARLRAREQATVLVIPSEADDAELWEKANAVIDRVPSLQRILVVGGKSDPGRKIIGFDEALSRGLLMTGDNTDRDTLRIRVRDLVSALAKSS